jgi:hypothetical protein
LVIIGSENEIHRVLDILQMSELNTTFIGKILPNAQSQASGYIGNMNQLTDIITIFKLNDIIFCSKDVSSNDIIEAMSSRDWSDIEFKIAPEESVYVIGSNSVNRSGEYYSILNVNRINSSENKRNKWLVDKMCSGILLILMPVLIWLVPKKKNFLGNLLLVIQGKKSLVGFNTSDISIHALPKIKPGCIEIGREYDIKQLSPEQLHRLNLVYAKDYSPWKDAELIWKHWKDLGA